MKTQLIKYIAGVILSCYVSLTAHSQGHGEIRGIIKSTDLEVIPFATIKVLQADVLIGGTTADENGKYSYKPLTPGLYEILVIDAGHQTQPVNGIKVVPNEATYVDVKLNPNMLGVVDVVAPAITYVQKGVDNRMFSMVSLDSKELMQSAGYERGDIKGALESMSADVVEDGDGEVHFRGGRSDASGFFVDGVRTLNANTVPGLAIENITMFTGGVPAMYGDVSSGVVVITTKSYFSGIREKNMRVNAIKQRKAEEQAKQKAKEDEENRQKEIEAEKAKEKALKEQTTTDTSGNTPMPN